MSCDFSLKHYKKILQIGLDHGYRFISFDDLTNYSNDQKICIVRHDVDYMPEWSPHFGEIEKDLGISATYFFQVCARPYNLRETKNYQAAHELIKMGHTIGLHFDLTWKEGMEWEEVVLYCERDKSVFKAITDLEPCNIISFHNPHRFVDLILNQEIPNLRHVYEKAFFSSIKYISDSQGWYEGCMCKLFASKKYNQFQFLTHPYIWPKASTGDFIQDIARMIKFRSDELTQYLVNFHPVCRRNEDRLRQELQKIQYQHSLQSEQQHL